MKDYFSKDVKERETHKLKMLFKFTDIDLIGLPEKFGNHSTAYRYILGEKVYEYIPMDNQLPMFCSLVEFYGKDFFDKLPKEEKTLVKDFYDFYLENELGFRLSDPSIVDNTIESGESGSKNENEIVKESTDNDNITNRQKNYHIGKTILFGLLAIGVGFLFGWLYALIPVALLIVLAILDHKFNFLPGPKKILSCVMPCLSCLKETKEQDKNPEQDENVSMKDTEIEN